MKISKISIQNFRSIKFAEITPDNFNVFVGQNNHGKTNFFEAIEWFFNGTKRNESIEDIRFGRTGQDEVYVQIEFVGAQDGANSMKHEANKTKMLGVLSGSDSITVKRSSSDQKKRTIFINENWIEKTPTGFDSAFNDFLPKFEYVNTKTYFEDVGKYSKTTPIGIMLSGVLSTILEKSSQYQDFREKFEFIFNDPGSDIKTELDALSGKVKIYLEKQFPDCTKVSFEIFQPDFEDLLKNFDTSVDDGVETRACEKGDGMQRALMLAILQSYADFRKQNEDLGKSFLFFIDEAELHLHPTAQRKLKNVLLDLSVGGDQVFINTHSSVLVSDEHENQHIYKVEKINKETNITETSQKDKPYIIYDLLGGSPADLLLPRNFLIVEGKTELEFLGIIIKRFYSDKPEIQIIPANGDASQARKSINAIEQVFKPIGKSIYKERAIILLDKQRAGALDGIKRDFPNLETNGQLFELNAGSIEEYYPTSEGWKKTSAEVSVMDSRHKIELATTVASNIEQNNFESEMSIIFSAINKCWELSYNN